MPTHLHIIVFDHQFDVPRLRQTLMDMRKFTGRQLADYVTRSMPDAFKQTMYGTKRTDRRRQFWQQSKHPIPIWTQDFWRTKIEYIHDNPCRKGLVREAAHWRFSSAGYWLNECVEENDVILTPISW